MGIYDKTINQRYLPNSMCWKSVKHNQIKYITIKKRGTLVYLPTEY